MNHSIRQVNGNSQGLKSPYDERQLKILNEIGIIRVRRLFFGGTTCMTCHWLLHFGERVVEAKCVGAWHERCKKPSSLKFATEAMKWEMQQRWEKERQNGL